MEVISLCTLYQGTVASVAWKQATSECDSDAHCLEQQSIST